ncbi:RNA recognition motif-containing protein [Apophysomyces sp. BC1034]|nr:RNA recognition motif-containing protein [Apophysomyces sp. BC1015]KAG0183172.1 RNA recognition motif-containing protein [Apophysomyces sp. BC1021]KAG0189667.1 RNA recognition motif-containing protein [Apophysomyces sp. BC1034]
MATPQETNSNPAQETQHNKSTLFVRGLPYKATSKDLEEFFEDVGPIRKCFVVIDKSEGDIKEGDPNFKNKGFGYVRFALADDARQAMEKLDSVKFMGQRKLNMSYARDKEAPGTEEAKPKKEIVKKVRKVKADPDAVNRGARLIVRNLPWKYREADLKKLFEKHGKVLEVQLPRKYTGGPLRGFAFIQFEKVKQAEKAVEALNATEHAGRTIAVDWSLAKERFTKLEEEENEAEEDEEKSDTDEDEDEDKSDADEDKEMGESDESENEDTDADSDVEMTESKEKKERKFPQVSEGATLFIRNLLFETTEEDLKEHFTQWGRVIYARITRDRETQLSRGTGFVCMHQKEDAEKCVEEAEELRKMSQKEESTDQSALDQLMSKREKKKKGTMYKSILTPDAGTGLGLKFTLNGRVLDVTLAVDRNQALKIKEDRSNLRKKEDTRNLYLMREGVVFPDTPAAETMTPAELQKRQMSFSFRKKQIASNPSMYISKTRLSIRNLPVSVDDTALRKLGTESIQKFKEQVKASLRTDLTKDEKEDGWQYRPRVKQAKIIRSKDRVDSASQKLRSKGYGFLEYTTHSHALAALRYLNNNPEVYDGKRLTVEFSLENKDVIERRQQRTSGAADERRQERTGGSFGDKRQQRTGGAVGEKRQRTGNSFGEKRQRTGGSFGDKRQQRTDGAVGEKRQRTGNSFGEKRQRTGGSFGDKRQQRTGGGKPPRKMRK